MSPDRYTELIEFLGRKFDRIEQRLRALEVSHESLRDQVELLADGQSMSDERSAARFDRIELRFDKWEVDLGTVQLEHERRTSVLEAGRRDR
mgnify:FL=1|jgi:hypothetical protein